MGPSMSHASLLATYGMIMIFARAPICMQPGHIVLIFHPTDCRNYYQSSLTSLLSLEGGH
jgi:hypothetical protein